jgi:hypothetical protein
MTDFDTSGYVLMGRRKMVRGTNELRFSDISPFTQGYVEAMFADLLSQKAFKRGDPVRLIDAEVYECRVIVGEAEKGFWRCALPGASHGFIGKAWHHSYLAYDVGFSDLAPETLARIIADCAVELFPRDGDDDLRDEGVAFYEERQERLRSPAFPPLTVQIGDDGKVRFA